MKLHAPLKVGVPGVFARGLVAGAIEELGPDHRAGAVVVVEGADHKPWLVLAGFSLWDW